MRSVGLLMTALAFAAAAPIGAYAQEKKMERSVTVAGAASIGAEPDMAAISTGVISEAETAKDALARNSQTMKKVIDGLKAQGIDAKDLQTHNFHINPRYANTKDGQAPRIVGYSVTNNVRVLVRDVTKLGETVDAVVTLGANQAGQITFIVSKAESLKDEARKAAIANALRRAKLYAEAAGATVGPVISISEEASQARPMPMARAAMSGGAVPIEAGTQQLDVHVQVTWALQ